MVIDEQKWEEFAETVITMTIQEHGIERALEVLERFPAESQKRKARLIELFKQRIKE